MSLLYSVEGNLLQAQAGPDRRAIKRREPVRDGNQNSFIKPRSEHVMLVGVQAFQGGFCLEGEHCLWGAAAQPLEHAAGLRRADHFQHLHCAEMP